MGRLLLKKNKRTTPYQKCAKKKLQKFRKAYDKTTIEEAPLLTIQAEKRPTNHQFDENSELEEAENQFEDEMRHANDSGLPITRGDVWIKAHRNKKGEPVNEIAKEKMEKLKEMNSYVPCGKDDALSHVLGPDPNGHLRGVGYGVTASTLFGVNQCVGRMDSLETRCKKLEAELSSLYKVLADLNIEPSYSYQPSSDDLHEQVNSTPQDNQNANSGGDASKVANCKLFRLVPEDVVAESYWFTDDPNALVHHQPLGPGYSKVAVVVANQEDALLVRKKDAMETINDAVGSFVAWPTNSIIKE